MDNFSYIPQKKQYYINSEYRYITAREGFNEELLCEIGRLCFWNQPQMGGIEIPREVLNGSLSGGLVIESMPRGGMMLRIVPPEIDEESDMSWEEVIVAQTQWIKQRGLLN